MPRFTMSDVKGNTYRDIVYLFNFYKLKCDKVYFSFLLFSYYVVTQNLELHCTDQKMQFRILSRCFCDHEVLKRGPTLMY